MVGWVTEGFECEFFQFFSTPFVNELLSCVSSVALQEDKRERQYVPLHQRPERYSSMSLNQERLLELPRL